MPGPVPGIHAFLRAKTRMAGTSPAMMANDGSTRQGHALGFLMFERVEYSSPPVDAEGPIKSDVAA